MKSWQPAFRSMPVRPRTLVRHGEDLADRVVTAMADCARIVKTPFVLFSILDTMSLRHIHGVRALSGAVLAEVVLIAAAFGWVAIYSYLINPDQPVSVYEQHAVDAGPWISIGVGIPLFYGVARWVARKRSTAVAFCAIFLLFDVAVLATVSGPDALSIGGLIILSYVTKALATWFGARPDDRAPEVRTA